MANLYVRIPAGSPTTRASANAAVNNNDSDGRTCSPNTARRARPRNLEHLSRHRGNPDRRMS